MYREQHGEYDDLHTVGGIKAILKKKLIFQVSQHASHFVQPRPAFPLQWYFLTLHIPILSYLRKQEKPVLSKKPMTFLFNFKIRDEYHNIEYVTLWIFTLIVFSFRGWVFLILAADYFLSVLIGQTTQRLMLKCERNCKELCFSFARLCCLEFLLVIQNFVQCAWQPKVQVWQ